MNEQKPEGRAHDIDFLEVNSIFDTIQGEGPFSGNPATFIRLAGCNLQCTWCDTEYTERKDHLLNDILAKVNHKLVVITGGEPLRQNIIPLIKALEEAGRMVQIETNGTLWLNELEETNAVIVVSPKTTNIHSKFMKMRKSNSLLVYIKMVIGCEAYPSQPNQKGGEVIGHYKPDFIIPLDEKDPQLNNINNKFAIQQVIKHDSKLQVQLHKVVGIE